MSTEEAEIVDVLRSAVKVAEAPKYDLKQYISAYKGRTVFRRLFLIACSSVALQEEAARLALIEAKKGTDVKNYTDAVALYQHVTPGPNVDGLVDPDWTVAVEKKNAAETKRLENELKQYKNNLIRESIRMGNEDLGSHYHSIGDLSSAINAYSRMRDYCNTPAHFASAAFRIISVTIEQPSWLAVQSQVQRVRGLSLRDDDPSKIKAKTAAAMGLQQMSLWMFKEAATSFLSVDPSLGDSYNDVLTSNDVAVYGGLCALASMTRWELQIKVLENTSFRNFLELEPHIRRAIAAFVNSKYSQCLEVLELYHADYLLDIYLQPVYESIMQRIRTKSIVQYFQPFSKVTLKSMQQMFSYATTDPDEISPAFIRELETLIQGGTLKARIDTETQTLVANRLNARGLAQKEALDTADKFIRAARLKLLRMNAVSAGLEVRLPPKQKGGIAELAEAAGMREAV